MPKKSPPKHVDFVVVSNRLPIDQRLDKKGSVTWTTTPGGLVAALQPVMAKRQAAWVGWPGTPDETVEPFTAGKTTYVPVGLSQEQVANHYEGFSNSTIWPLYHDAIVPPVFDREWWDTYQSVNAVFADAAAAIAAPGATVWVHDYQLQLVPKLLRDRRPDLVIGYFHHIPFPGYGLFAQLPWRREILDGLLGADVVGFQRRSDAANMVQAVRRNFGYSMDRPTIRVPLQSPSGTTGGTPTTSGKTREVIVDAFPISVSFSDIDELARRPEVQERAERIREDVGNPRHIFLGVDRLDYTKGIGHRLKAFGEALADGTLDAKNSVFVQLASPSRERVESYQHLRDDIELQVGRLNGEFGQLERPAIVYLHQNMAREEMIALYLAADVLVVSPLRDGMNLVAKEFIASRVDTLGVLILSEFTGAADELDDAIIVNPHDIDGLKSALSQATKMPKREVSKRMTALRERVATHNVEKWATSFLDALARTGRSPK
jgi:trehalose 6-phosphate synthase